MCTCKQKSKTPTEAPGNFNYVFTCTSDDGNKKEIKVSAGNDNESKALAELECEEEGGRTAGDYESNDANLARAAIAAKLTYAQVKQLVEDNNRSANAQVTTELVISLIWKESGFRPDVKNPTTTATGLMQMTTGAVADVNNNTPAGVHYTHAEMTVPSKNIQCGTYYLAERIERAGGKLKEGLNGYGTGPGYADNIISCAACLRSSPPNPQSCLNTIHGLFAAESGSVAST